MGGRQVGHGHFFFDCLGVSGVYTHIHRHTHIYINKYIYIYSIYIYNIWLFNRRHGMVSEDDEQIFGMASKPC